MSLKVWLPLNGTLENKGTTHVTITAPSGVTVDTTGKIGSCYTCDGSTNGSTNACNLIMNEFSMAAWIRINTRVNAWHCPFKLINSTDSTKYQYIGFGCENSNGTTLGFHFYKTIDGTNTKIFDRYITPTATGTWMHLAVTYNGVVASYYLNGALVTSDSIATAVQNTPAEVTQLLMFGTDGSRGGNTIKDSLNDVRIYDHCLSPAEVHEISQGLVLHYKLDNLTQGNLLRGTGLTYNDILGFAANSSTNWTQYVTYYNGNASIHTFAHNEDTILLSTTGNLGIAFRRKATDIQLDSNSYYTLSCEAKCTKANANLCIGLSYYSNNNAWVWRGGTNAQAFTSTTDWQTFKLTFKPDADTQYISYCFTVTGVANGTDTLTLRHCKMELGSVATPWAPAAEDYNLQNIVEDSSGYNHHGTITGTITSTNDTTRYNTAIHISATNQYIKCGAITTAGFANSYTFAWWGKSDTYSGKMHWGFSDGVRLNGIYNGILWNTGDSSNNPLYKPGTTTQVSAPTSNVWHHFVMVGNGTTCQVYQDGVLWAQAKTYKTITGTQIYINGWDTSTSYKYTDLSMSDFRVYCTALSAADIKALYEVGAKIDNKGNIHTYELKENNTNKLLKTGVFDSPLYIEEYKLVYNKGWSFNPTGANNSCAGNIAVDFSPFVGLNRSIILTLEGDLSWSNITPTGEGTFAAYFQGNNRKVADNTWAWAGSNYAHPGTNQTVAMTANATGSEHFKVTKTIPASWFDTYNGSNVSYRTNYTTGTITLSNFSVTATFTKAQISSTVTTGQNIIEF